MKYAIIESGGKQYKAVEGDFVEVDRLEVQAGSDIRLEKVFLLVEGDQVSIGTPTIQDTSVLAKVVEHFKGQKLTVFKYRPKKRIRVKTGHRQSYTRLLIEQVGKTKTKFVEKPEVIEKPFKSLESSTLSEVKSEKAVPVKKKPVTNVTQ